MNERFLLLHGYSDRASSLERWREELASRGLERDRIHLASFATLSNELRIADISEALEREIRRVMATSSDDGLNLIVHSTGMLVVRDWLRLHPNRCSMVRRIVGLAPATFGSPLAHRGRSWLGAALKGNREWGPDFLEAGDQILEQLELGSPYLWDLAHFDLVGEASYFRQADSAALTVFCGASAYSGARQVINPEGSDGTVRFAGASPVARKAFLDLTEDNNRRRAAENRFFIEDWPDSVPRTVLLSGVNHATILSDPPAELCDAVADVLRCAGKVERDALLERIIGRVSPGGEIQNWMQVIVHAVDDRGDPIDDFYLEIIAYFADGATLALQDAGVDVHRNSNDPSFLTLHFLSDWFQTCPEGECVGLEFRVIASSGSQRVGYLGYGSEKLRSQRSWDGQGKWDATIRVDGLVTRPEFRFFEPLSTTLLEVRLDRQPLPLESGSSVLRVDGKEC